MSPRAKFRANIHKKKSELWAINCFQDGGCRHLEFTTVANFGHITCSSWLHSCKILLIWLKRQLSY